MVDRDVDLPVIAGVPHPAVPPALNTRANKITVVRVPLTADFVIGDDGAGGDIEQKGNGEMEDFVDRGADFVGAVIFYDDPTETSLQYAPYKLTVNGVVQPGGGS